MPLKGIFALFIPSSYKLALRILEERTAMMQSQTNRYPENEELYVLEFIDWVKKIYDNSDFLIIEPYYEKPLKEIILKTTTIAELIQKNEFLLKDYSPQQRQSISKFLKSGLFEKCINGSKINGWASLKMIFAINNLAKSQLFNDPKQTGFIPKVSLFSFFYSYFIRKQNFLELIQDFFSELFGEKAYDLSLHYIAVQLYPELKKIIEKYSFSKMLVKDDKNVIKIPIKIREVKKGREIDLEQDAYAILTYYFQKARAFLSADNHISDVSASKAMQILSGYNYDNIRKKLGSLDFTNNQRVVVKEKLEEVIKLINKDLAKK